MKKVKSNTFKISDIFTNDTNKSNYGHLIKIPRYQRPFTWSKKEIDSFLNDVLYSKNNSYYIGTMHIVKHNNYIELLDGQQRTTTLFLILLYLFEEYGFDVKNTVHQAYKKDFKWRISWSDEVEKTFNLILRGEKTNSNYKKAYQTIKSFFIKMKKDEIESFVERINNISITIITLPNDINAHALFNGLNNRGKPLILLDNIKNILFSAGKDRDPDEIKAAWNDFLEELSIYDAHDGKFANGVLTDYFMYEKGQTPRAATNWMEEKFWDKNNTNNTTQEKDISFDPLSESKTIISEFKEFAKNVVFSWKDKTSISGVMPTAQVKRFDCMWNKAFKNNKFKQTKPLSNKIIKYHSKETAAMTLQILFMVYIIKQYFLVTKNKTNVFESEIKKQVYKTNGSSDLFALLKNFIISKGMLRTVFEKTFENAKSWSSDRTALQDWKELIHLSILLKKNTNLGFSDITWEHYEGQKNDKECFFALEFSRNHILSRIENPTYAQKHQVYSESELSFPKKICTLKMSDDFKGIRAEEKEHYLKMCSNKLRIKYTPKNIQ